MTTRFSIPQIKAKVTSEKSLERERVLELKKKLLQIKKDELEKEKKSQLFVKEFGLEILKSAIDGKQSLFINSNVFVKGSLEKIDFNSEVIKRGFELHNGYISWEYPETQIETLSDCISAKFVDWLSDIYGRDLVLKIFTKIEELDFDGEKNIKIKVMKQLTSNEYTNDESEELYMIFGVPIPFDLACITNMFALLNYKVRLENPKIDMANTTKILVIEWD